MNAPERCPHCQTVLSLEAHFCPSCGRLVTSESANWYDRLCAAGIDITIWLACASFLIWLGVKWWVIFPIWLVLTEVGYQVKGSIGKSFLGLSVSVKNRARHYLRETIGKLASVATFGIGFLMVFSSEKLALHDYMARTSVVRVDTAQRVRQAISSLLLLLAIVSIGYFGLRPETIHRTLAPPTHNQPPSLNAIVSQVPAVMTIYVYDPLGKPIGLGSGFLISADGVGVTNFHVLKDAYSADAKLGDGRLFHVLAVHAYDSEKDVAIFQLGRKTSKGIEQARDLPSLRMSSTDVQTGDHIATVGSPEGLSNSVADGLVSAIRTDNGKQFIQISAPISPGSSGGPVFNLEGEVVAISTFQWVEGQNLNFAIPIEQVVKIQEQRANLTLEQVYWQTHPSREARSAIKTQTDPSEQPSTSARTIRSSTGTYLGTVHNLNADSKAGFGIFVEEEQGLVWGCMAVTMPLVGSGPLYGSVEGANIALNVTSSGFTMNFTGIREGNRVTGTYTVQYPNRDPEQGEFILEKKDSNRLPKDFDPKDCPTDADVNK